jgi:AcrR family transcriptional regulator
MADIAGLAGVSVGLLYRYFRDKNDVIRGIVEQDLALQMADLEAALDALAADPSTGADKVVRVFERRASDRARTGLMLEIAAESMRNPEVKALAVEGRETLRGLFERRCDGRVAEAMVRLQLVVALYSGISIQLHQQEGGEEAMLAMARGAARQIMASPLEG